MIYVLRIVHILSGAFWYGSVLFLLRFLIPSVRAVGPAGGAVMAQLNQRRLSTVLIGAGSLTVGSGIWLMLIVSGGTLGPWMQSGMGRTLAMGASLAIIALLIGITVNAPTTRRMGALAATIAKRGGPPSPEEMAEIGRLMKRNGIATTIVATLLTLTVMAMAVARYV